MKLLVIFFFLSAKILLSEPIEINAVGDIMPGSVTPKTILPADSGKIFLNGVEKYLNHGISIGNFECAVTGDSVKPVKCSEQSREAGRCYEFGTKPFLVKRLSEIGFDILSLDNNHALDYGKKGLHNSDSVISSYKMLPLLPASYKELAFNGKKITFIPFGFDDLSIKLWDTNSVRNTIRNAASNGNPVVVFFHGGAEGKKAANVRDTMEYFLDEKRGNVVDFAHLAIESGADLVLGSGPHVLRALELYKGKLIAYSLGNFLTHGNFNIRGVNGISVILNVKIDDRTGNFISGKLIPVRQYTPGIPKIDSQKSAIKIMAELIKKYGKSFIKIDDDGNLTAE